MVHKFLKSLSKLFQSLKAHGNKSFAVPNFVLQIEV